MQEITSQPQFHYLRLYQIIGHKKRGVPPLLPVSASTWWAGVKSGKFPQAIKLGMRITVWRSDEIDALLRDLSEVKP
ncbi:helix-turn-helix transcriptional regulator [Zwartia vadi]|uniref:helix-turn-helix transcriptional regulator n=1 Tax=Zwartia vadi TaxID=3058168 RepID=UPI0025B61279|nr:AlpA family phage regulatory protein [Zwartia vadi]MDN3987023.1 AlpA family phage regulatory protein [Zwartia vadi]